MALLRAAEGAGPAVVRVRVAGETPRSRGQAPLSGSGALSEMLRKFFPKEFGERPPEREPRPALSRSGSGFIIDPNGYVVTSHHIVDGATSIEVFIPDGRVLPAQLVGSDLDTDLALLKVDATGLPTIPLGNSGGLKVGELVLALGKPQGKYTIAVGSVSGTGPGGTDQHAGILQTDIGITAEGSGGPLLSARGEAVGIATAIANPSGAFQSIGLATPIDRAKPVLQQLQTAGRAGGWLGWLGLAVQPVTRELASPIS